MFHIPDYYHNMSIRLSEVLDDIGVNETMVLKRRKTALLEETIETIADRATGRQRTNYILGSRSESTVTVGLQSDVDTLLCQDYGSVIQDWSEWAPHKRNYLMVQNETTPPGYCLLQKLRDDVPLPVPYEDGIHHVKDTTGRVLYKNTVVLDAAILIGRRRQGPAATLTTQSGYHGDDLVVAYPCKSWPQSPRAWLNQQETNTWPTAEMKRYAKTTRCFVVGVGSKVSENEAFEWRLSTSLAERCFMFNLNVTQIRCYILMKMILKTYINLENEAYISSYMCKTILFHCISRKHLNIWKECNILNCLNYCIFTLNRCILNGNCPHFIVHENNLMAGKISTKIKHKLLKRMSKLIPCEENSLSGIQIDNLGHRLQIKLNMISEVNLYSLQSNTQYQMSVTGGLSLGIARSIFANHKILINLMKNESLEMKVKNLLKIVIYLIRYYRNSDKLERTACKLLAPIACTSIGSLKASQNIQINSTVSSQALAWIETGLDSDVASSRLKFASIIYCTGDMERAAFILNSTEEKYIIEVTESVCVCYRLPNCYIKGGFILVSSQNDVEAVKYITAFCVMFSPCEINCVPRELKYEMFRSTQEDLQHRGLLDHWMDCAVVDSLPYLYFLQYKTYGNLHRPEEQQQALNKLVWVIETERNLGHRETALNLLGQCMEQENRPVDALQCYMLSLGLRESNNAARIHICMCLNNLMRLHKQ